jgi:acetyltransferase-like isoleucine patch superfamily enzyme
MDGRPVRVRDMSLPQKLLTAARNPGNAWVVGLAIAKGSIFRLWCRLLRPRVSIGRGLRIYGSLVIRGPGRVTLGRDVEVHSRVTPFTHDEGAHIEVGDATKLDGTRFGCVLSIKVGRDCLLANARILDSSFHSLDRVSERLDVFNAPVEIGDGTWVSPDAALLPGTRIGAYSVVSLGAICKGSFPDYSLLLGNPARVASSLPRG